MPVYPADALFVLARVTLVMHLGGFVLHMICQASTSTQVDSGEALSQPPTQSLPERLRTTRGPSQGRRWRATNRQASPSRAAHPPNQRPELRSTAKLRALSAPDTHPEWHAPWPPSGALSAPHLARCPMARPSTTGAGSAGGATMQRTDAAHSHVGNARGRPWRMPAVPAGAMATLAAHGRWLPRRVWG